MAHVIYWSLFILALGAVGAAVYKLSGGRFGAPPSETPDAFFARVAKATKPVGELAFPPGLVAAANVTGVPIAQRIRTDLRWRRVPTEAVDFEVYEGRVAGVADDGLPPGSLLVTPGAISAALPGPAYAIRGDFAALYPRLNNRWLAYAPITVRSPESAAAADAGKAAAMTIGGYGSAVGQRLPSAAVLALAERGDA